MNFISTFDELNKLYEEVVPEVEKDEEVVEEACDKEELTEAADEAEIEIVDDETPVEEMSTDVVPVEEPVEEEPKQFILECDKCGALVIKDEADIVADEDSDLVNIEDECQFCEETKGYKIIGTMIPYEATTETTEGEPEEKLDELLDANISLGLDGGAGNDVSVLGR